MKWAAIGILPVLGTVAAFRSSVLPAAHPGAAPAVAHASIEEGPHPRMPGEPRPDNALTPGTMLVDGSDARALAADGTHVWVATGGGLEQYTHGGTFLRRFGTGDGLDTVDVRDVRAVGGVILTETATGHCVAGAGEPNLRFVCQHAPPSPAQPSRLGDFRGLPLSARLAVAGSVFLATRGGGVFRAPQGDLHGATRLGPPGAAPKSFVQTAAHFRGALWLGTFDDGLHRVPLAKDGTLDGPLAERIAPVPSPVRMVNRLAASSRTLFVAGNEGLFASDDGVRFDRVSAIAQRPMTGIAIEGTKLWVASSEAVYRLELGDTRQRLPTTKPKLERSFVYPAGTHAIQSIAVGTDGVAWLATEDRGVVRVDERGARSFDSLAGLPTSWFVAVVADGHGGTIATSLRHGTVHVKSDGSWQPLDWSPNPWGLSLAQGSNGLCIGTQGGAACRTGDRTVRLAGLPDPRVHTFVPVGDSLLVGTEGGLAVYAL
jgi:ligand-binding sensor domain-containing protein